MFESEGGFRGAYSNIRGAGLQGTREELTGLATRAVDAEALLQSSLSPGLRDWDLWGPLIFCLLLSLLLSFSPRAQAEQKDIIFSGVFATIWLGEALVTFQIRLLGGNMYVKSSSCYWTVLTKLFSQFLCSERVHHWLHSVPHGYCCLTLCPGTALDSAHTDIPFPSRLVLGSRR